MQSFAFCEPRTLSGAATERPKIGAAWAYGGMMCVGGTNWLEHLLLFMQMSLIFFTKDHDKGKKERAFGWLYMYFLRTLASLDLSLPVHVP